MWTDLASGCKNPDAAADLSLATSMEPWTEIRHPTHGQFRGFKLVHPLIAADYVRTPRSIYMKLHANPRASSVLSESSHWLSLPAIGSGLQDTSAETMHA